MACWSEFLELTNHVILTSFPVSNRETEIYEKKTDSMAAKQKGLFFICV